MSIVGRVWEKLRRRPNMQKADIAIGEEYGFRETRKGDAPLQRVRILQHARGKKWKAEWIEPNPGLVDYVEAQHLVVRWTDSAAFIADEKAAKRLLDDNERNGYEDDSPLADALYTVFDGAGDQVRFYRGNLNGPPDALERVRRRARVEASPRTELEYVDRNGVVHLAFSEALALAKAFCAAEPSTMLTYIEPSERKWTRDVATGSDESRVELLSKYRAAWALVRQWTAQDPSATLRLEVERLQRLVLDAVYALQRAGLDQVAHRLREELGEAKE